MKRAKKLVPKEIWPVEWPTLMESAWPVLVMKEQWVRKPAHPKSVEFVQVAVSAEKSFVQLVQ